LEENESKASRERLTLVRLYEDLRGLGYGGSYAAVRRYAIAWREKRAGATADAYVPLTFAPGEAYQFDWSHEIVVMDGVTTIVKVAHLRLCHSRMMFVRAYPRETQEMVFDAHERAFAFFKGACGRGIYDNMKTAVETIFVGKDRQYNRRFLQMCSHHLVEPVACTPASGWEKGQVENQVGLVRERFFTPRLRFKSYDELNAWLLDRCLSWAKAHAHPERSDQTIWEVFEEERPRLVPYRGRFDGFHALPASVSKTCLVRFDNNKYSVSASAVGRPVDIHAYAEHIVIRQDGRTVAEHPRSYGRGKTIYDPWHYVPVLARKPGALRNGAPFKDWVLPTALDRVRRKLAGSDDGDRQMVKILAAVLTDGLPAVEAACAQALSEGVHSADVVINILARQRDPGPAATIMTPEALRLRHAPTADCARYDQLRRA
jgi:transposase